MLYFSNDITFHFTLKLVACVTSFQPKSQWQFLHKLHVTEYLEKPQWKWVKSCYFCFHYKFFMFHRYNYCQIRMKPNSHIRFVHISTHISPAGIYKYLQKTINVFHYITCTPWWRKQGACVSLFFGGIFTMAMFQNGSSLYPITCVFQLRSFHLISILFSLIGGFLRVPYLLLLSVFIHT